MPVAAGDAGAGGAARNRHGGVVLLRSVDAIRHSVVGDHRVELRSGLVVERAPGPAAVERDGSAAVAAVHHSQRVFRVDPEIVVVAVRRLHFTVSPAAVG